MLSKLYVYISKFHFRFKPSTITWIYWFSLLKSKWTKLFYKYHHVSSTLIFQVLIFLVQSICSSTLELYTFFNIIVSTFHYTKLWFSCYRLQAHHHTCCSIQNFEYQTWKKELFLYKSILENLFINLLKLTNQPNYMDNHYREKYQQLNSKIWNIMKLTVVQYNQPIIVVANIFFKSITKKDRNKEIFFYSYISSTYQ